MKKFLLFAFVACAMSANAQKVVNLNNVQSANLVQMTANNSFKAAKAAQAAQSNSVSVAAAPAQKVAVCEGKDSSHSLYGKFIEIFPESDITIGNNVLSESEIDPETGAQLVKLTGTFKGWGQEVYGIYDEDAKTVTIPAEQYVGTADYNGMELYLFAFQALPSEEEGKLNLGGDWDEEGNLLGWHDLVYDVKTNDAGTIYLELQEGGWCLLATDGLDEDSQTLGVWTSDLEGHMLNKANWTAHYYACYVGAAGWGEWEEKKEDVYVESFDDAMMVNGFDGQFVFEMGLDAAAGTCSLGNQDVFYYPSYDRMYSIWGTTDAREITNYYDFAMTGFYSAENEYVALYNMETQQGKQFYICTQYEEGVGAYMLGTFDGLELWSMCGPEGAKDGIDTVLAPNTKKAIYNLAGQRSNTYVKGINIENGKKVVR